MLHPDGGAGYKRTQSRPKGLLAGQQDGLLATCQLHPLLLPSGVHTVTTDAVDSHDWQLCKCARRSANMTGNKTSTWDIWVAAQRWHHLVCSSGRDGKEVPCRRGSHSSPSRRLTRGEAGHTWEGHQTLIRANWSQPIGKLPIPAVDCWLVSEGYGAEAAAETRVHPCVRNSGVRRQQRQSGDRKHEWCWLMWRPHAAQRADWQHVQCVITHWCLREFRSTNSATLSLNMSNLQKNRKETWAATNLTPFAAIHSAKSALWWTVPVWLNSRPTW